MVDDLCFSSYCQDSECSGDMENIENMYFREGNMMIMENVQSKVDALKEG
jgi:hypothetical protein